MVFKVFPQKSAMCFMWSLFTKKANVIVSGENTTTKKTTSLHHRKKISSCSVQEYLDGNLAQKLCTELSLRFTIQLWLCTGLKCIAEFVLN